MDTYLFIEIIESVSGITFIRDDVFEDVKVRIYEGLNGRMVIIDVSDEDITTRTCMSHLTKLGIEYLIKALFPKEDLEAVIAPSNISKN
ncbi:hypothetical protein [Parafilimonas terrae]|uniref:Uncharacterized protein n=1 Tax=Parafilimonas terrae TaxID=1465490 RepID=A0A1I5ZGW3_9BACT|nr:hypothetical protein [Parafilimonas terrae]SFQ55706.1 hypothetical protein SAMN05444277_1284 [Parafilimonas terrae]